MEIKRWIARGRVPLGLAALALAALACEPGSVERAPIPPGPQFSQPESDFENTWAIVHAIGEGTFAERAGLEDELEAARALPAPLKVEFASGTEVAASQRERIEAFAAEIRGDAGIALRVVGCSDPSGSAALNLRISRQRAESVAAALTELGIDEDRFDAVLGRGEDCEVQERAVNVEPVRAAERQPA